MNYRLIALALGLSIAAAATAEEIRAKILAKLSLAKDAADTDIETAIAARNTPPPRRTELLARGSYTFSALAAAGEYELLIYGSIGRGWWSEVGVDAIDVVRELQLVNANTIHVHVSSDGGSIQEGLAIYNALKRHPARIVTNVDSVAFSIASVISAAGDEVRMPNNAMQMLHGAAGGMVGAIGNAEEMRVYAGEVLNYADILDKVSGQMLEIYVAKAGEDKREQIKALLLDGKDHYYTAAEAKELGLCDVIEEAIALAAVRKTDLSRFTTLPPAAAAFHQASQPKDSPMNYRLIALALGLPIAANATDEDIKKQILAKLSLAATASDSEIETAIAAAARSTPEASAAERARITARNGEIRTLAATMRRVPTAAAHVDELEREFLADATLTTDGFRTKLLAKLGEGAEPLNPGNPLHVTGGADAVDKRREGMTNALLGRMGAAKPDGTNPFRGLSLREMARNSLAAAGQRVEGLEPLDIAERALRFGAAGQGSSDFPVMLENTVHKLVLNGFKAQPGKWEKFCKTGDVSDFREWNRLVPGMISNLDDVNEHGEYKNKAIPDGEKNPVSVKRRGNVVSVTPEVIVNDDIGHITDTATGYGRSAHRTIDRVVFALLASNPVLKSDGKALFHLDHGNLGAAGAYPSVAALAAIRTAMGKQKAPGGDDDYLDITPAIWVGPIELADTVNMIIGAEWDVDVLNKFQVPNKVRSMVRDVVGTPRLSGNPYYLFADPNVAPVIEVVFLNGQREPRVVQQEVFRTAGLEWRIELPFGAGAIDYRGGYKQPGANAPA